ncbi:GGDEF domain-containing protein [Bradyrhizobium sp. STM 3562]|uniref:GGDEF domain-containing protein n=1 Tax=Bradyrhizobium sp. STM 3562 TaxID=578924 RepID=UPI00388FF7A4
MLSVPTLWVTIVLNFLAMALVWTYVARSYPKFTAARFWAGASLSATLGAAVSMLRGTMDPLLPLVGGGGLMIFAMSLAVMGVRRFYDLSVNWLAAVLVLVASCACLTFFLVVDDNMAMRIAVYSLGQSIPLATTLPLLLMRREARDNPGARLAGIIGCLIIGVHVIRSIWALSPVAGTLTVINFNAPQAALILVQVFLAMALNFGYLLMAMDRLRNEVADLALIDDLTGVANRRHLVQRLSEECARSERSGEPFALLVIDLDGFKSINDTHGHAAGDACLQHFTLMAQTRLRPGDLLARTGGDEFCIVLPSSSLREGIMIARRVLDVCRQDAEGCVGADIPIAVSIGVAQWTREIGNFPDRLIAAADEALYAAKKEGKNRYAASALAPSLVPEPEPADAKAVRKPA